MQSSLLSAGPGQVHLSFYAPRNDVEWEQPKRLLRTEEIRLTLLSKPGEGQGARYDNRSEQARRFTDFFNTASAQLAADLISPNATFHVPGEPELLRGPAGYLET